MAKGYKMGQSGGGINKTLPYQLTAFTAVADNTPQVVLSWTNPTDYFEGVLIVKKTGSAPEGVNDGEKIYNGTGTSFVDMAVEYDITYYYRAFPYNSRKQYQTEMLTVSAKPVTIPDNFADATWAQVNAVSKSGDIPSTWVVGSEKDIVLSTGEVLTLAIVGINHDDLADGSGKAGFTLGLKHLMAETGKISNSSSYNGSFVGSTMYTWLINTLMPQLPEDLQAVIKTVNKKTSAGNKSTTIRTDAMKVFLFSEFEIWGRSGYSVAGEGVQYGYFSTKENRIKHLANGSGAATRWWLRSPCSTEGTYFCTIFPDGTMGPYGTYALYGVCFGFCV